MATQNVSFEIQNFIGIIKISKPETLNALSTNILTQLNDTLDKVIENKELRVLIITGEGRAFVAGADIAEMKNMSREEGFEYGKFGSYVFRKIELLPIPVIAAINGFALGGGLELAMACDIRIAGDKAKMGQPEVGLGITPGFSGTQRLARIVGLGRAKEMIFTAQHIRADKALEIGLVNSVVPQEELMKETLTLANQIVRNAPIAVRLSKLAINSGMQTDIDSAIKIENDLFADCFATKDQKEGMEAFVEKRDAIWKNE